MQHAHIRVTKCKGRNKMKKALALTLAIAMILIITSCGTSQAPAGTSSTSQATSAPATVSGSQEATVSETTASEATQSGKALVGDPNLTATIKLGIWPSDTAPETEIAMHQGFVAKMKELYPKVTIEPSYYQYAVDTYVAMASAGNAPTIFQPWFTEPQRLINAGLVADITDVLKAKGWEQYMNPGYKKMLSDSNGKIYGIPRDSYGLGLMLNIDLFTQAGLMNDDGTPKYPKTLDEMAVTAQTIKQKTGAAGFCLLAMDASGGWHFSNIAWNYGATLETYENGKWVAHLNTPECVAAMEYVKSLKWKYDCLTADPTQENWGSGMTQLGTGGAGMYFGANDAVDNPTAINGLKVDKLALVPFPAGPKGDQYMLAGGTAYMFAPNATPEQITACLAYLELMGKAPTLTQDSIDGMRTDAKRRVDAGIPVIPRIQAWNNPDYTAAELDVINQHKNVDSRFYQDYFDAINNKGELRAEEPAMAQEMYLELTKVLQKCVTNQDADVRKLLDRAQTNFQKLLDENINAQ